MPNRKIAIIYRCIRDSSTHCSCRKESTLILISIVIQCFNRLLWVLFPTLALFVIIIPFTTSGGELTQRAVFSTLSLLSFMGLNLHMCSNGILELSDGLVGMIRISVSSVL